MIPSFSRIEIRTETQSHLRTAARSFRELADKIDTIAGEQMTIGSCALPRMTPSAKSA